MKAENGYNYFMNLAIALDQTLNALTGGSCDETLSSRTYRKSQNSTAWMWLRAIIDTIFFFDKDHCKTSYDAEVLRKHIGRL